MAVVQEEQGAGDCPYCGTFVQFSGQGRLNIHGDVTTQVFAHRCPKCQQVTVVLDRGGQWKRYPPRQPKDILKVPSNVMQAFREAVLALEAGAPRAAACMIRRTVASACSEQGVPDEEGGRWLRLQNRIDRLKDKLLPATYAAAKAAKLLGDAGAHEEAEERLGEINPETVRSTIAVVRQFLANLYELPEQIKQLGIIPPEEQAQRP